MTTPRLADLFYRQPRLLVLTVALIVASGVSAFIGLPRLEDPVIGQRWAIVLTAYPGASAERVEALVTEKIEDELDEIDEIKLLRSTSRAGISVVSLELKDEVTETDGVFSRVRDRLGDVEAELPRGALPPRLEDTEMQPEAYAFIVGLVWEGEREGEGERETPFGILGRLAEELDDQIRAVPGTKNSKLYGRPDEEIRVAVDAVATADLGLTTADVSNALAASDAKVPAGLVRGPRDDVIVEVAGELDTTERIRATPLLATDDGRVVTVGDVASVRRTVAEPAADLAFVDGRPAVVVAARMSSSERIDLWAAAVRERVDAYGDTLPSGITHAVIMDQSRYVEARLGDLLWNLLFGAVLVLVVTLVMMGWRQALIVGISLPLASLMVLAGMAIVDMPIHQMSVTGLIIALGLLIDNAIVVVDEVGDRIRAGDEPGDAVAGGVRHLAVPLLGSTMTTVFAFLPIVLMPGGAGEFVGPIGLSVILSLVSSLALSLTVVPALLALLPARKSAGRGSWVEAGVRSERLTAGFTGALGFLARRPWVGVAIAVIAPIAGFVASTTMAEQFFPPADRDQIQVVMRLAQDAPLQRTAEVTREARRLMVEDPDVEAVHWFVGRTAPRFYYNLMAGQDGSPFFAQALVQLRRTESSQATVDRVQARLDAAFPEAQTIVRRLEQGPPFGAPIEVHVSGPDLDTLATIGAELRAHLATHPAVIHTRSTVEDVRPQLDVTLDEDELRAVGLDRAAVARQLDGALEGRVGGSVVEATEELDVRVRLEAGPRGRVTEVAALDLVAPGAAGAVGGAPTRMPLDAIGRIDLVPAVAAIPRRNGARVTTVEGYLRPGVLPAEVLADFQAEVERSGFELPPGYTWETGGEAAERDRAVGNLLAKVGVLLVLMAAALVLSFSSFRLAALIAAVATLSIGLALLSVWAFGFPFGFMAIVGSMGLVGVAVNDSIVVTAALREDAKAREGDPDAVVGVVLKSTRHVLATTFTTMAGFLPLLIAGGEFWPPLAIAIAGGVLGATLLALVLVPSVFVILARRGREAGCGMTAAT